MTGLPRAHLEGTRPARSLPSTARLRLVALVLLVGMSCSGGSGGGCGGGGCGSGCGDGTYMYPDNDPNRPDAILQNEVIRARITQGLIDFIHPLLPDLLIAQLTGGGGFQIRGNRLIIPIPDQNGIIDVDVAGFSIIGVDLRDAEASIFLDDLRPCPKPTDPACVADPANCRRRCMQLNFEQPNGVRLAVNDLRLGIRLKIRGELLGSDSSCPVFGDLEPGDVAANISINTLIEPGVGPDPDRNLDVMIAVSDVTLNGLSVDTAGSGVYCQESACQDCALEVLGNCLDPGGRCNECQLVCGGLVNALTSLASALIDLIRPLLNNILKPIVQNFVRSAVADLNGMPAKIETQIGLEDVTGFAIFSGSNPFGIFLSPEPGKFPVIDRGTPQSPQEGMEVTMTGGAEAELADCIGALDPFDMPKGPVPVLGGFDSRGRPYHLGLTLASSFLNQILYAVHRSGSLCMKISTYDIKDLTGGAFNLNASLLSLLAADLAKVANDTAPVIIQLKPRQQPVLDLGSGALIGQDAMGNDVYDWLMKIAFEELGLAFHVLIHDRYVRIFEVTMDINVGLNIKVLPTNQLEVAVGELRLDGFEEEFNELLPNADFAEVLPTLIDVALQALLTQQLTFDLDISTALSDALGGAPIFLHVNEIKRDGIQEDYLTLTLTLSSTTATTALSLGTETFAELAEDPELHELLPESPDLTFGRRLHPTGRVRLKVGEPLGIEDRAELEYQVRVDGGVWRVALPARPDGTILVGDTHLKLPGRHKIEVRAGRIDDYQSLDPTPTELSARIDPLPPSISAVVKDDVVQIRVRDLGSNAAELVLLTRLDDGPWRSLELSSTDEPSVAIAQLPLSEVGTATQLSLLAEDATGNQSPVAAVKVALVAAASDTEAGGGGCACRASKNAEFPAWTGLC